MPDPILTGCGLPTLPMGEALNRASRLEAVEAMNGFLPCLEHRDHPGQRDIETGRIWVPLVGSPHTFRAWWTVYRLFIDEVGHDNLKTANDPNERYLCLMGVMLHLPTAEKQLDDALNALKKEVFGTDAVVLHRREIIDKKPAPFDALNDPSKRKAFDDGLLEIIEACDYKAIAVHIDKKEHMEKYAVWVHQPYHYCLTAMMERYAMQLRTNGDKGDVMAEWRGIKPNRKLEAAYRHIFKFGTGNMKAAQFQHALSSGELKIRKKAANISGLQLADLLANPVARHLLCKRTGVEMKAEFGQKVVSILNASKFRRSYTGKIEGFGFKVLP